MSTLGRDEAFTLIELMIVIAIIGILAAIAIPQFESYRTKGFNSGAMWDAKNAATAEESYYSDHRVYTGTLSQLDGHGLSATENVVLTLSANDESYTLVSYHSNGDKSYTLTGPGGALTSN